MDGFVEIYPSVIHERPCPRCRKVMTAADWAITGQWTVARYHCQPCARSYWVDLPFNLGVLSPCYLCLEDGTVVRPGGPDWYANMTRAGWQSKTTTAVSLTRQVRRSVKNICLVNALGNCWGDAIATVAKLNALAGETGLGVVVLTTHNLAPHLPDFIAEAWLVNDYSHADAMTWNEGLAALVKQEVSRYETAYIPRIFQLPTVTPQELESLTGVRPFARKQWDARLNEAATVTFMWRDDRCWTREWPVGHWMNSRLAYRRGIGRLIRYRNQIRAACGPYVQARKVNELAQLLKRALPKLDFAVCGLGQKGSLDSWIKDLRIPRVVTETNRKFCERASRSHVVVGLIGSHMSLPAAHAGGVIDLVPGCFLRNVLSDMFVTTSDKRETLYLHRALPVGTKPAELAEIIISMLINYSCANNSLNGDYYGPLSQKQCDTLGEINVNRVAVMQRTLAERFQMLMGP